MKINKGQILKGLFTMTIDGNAIEKYCGEKTIKIGKEEYVHGFDHRIIGKNTKNGIEISYKIPHSWNDELIAGKNVTIFVQKIQIEAKEKNNKVKELEDKIISLESKLAAKELEIIKLNSDFISKAKQLNEKANQELVQAKVDLDQKLKSEKENISKYALANFIDDFMTPYGYLTSAIKAGESIDNPEVQNYVKGFSMLLGQFDNVFANHNISLITPNIGSEFNPEEEEVFDFVEDPKLENNTIVKVVRQGIKVSDRVVKPAGVTVVKNK